MFDTFQNRLVITGKLVAQTALRVGAGKSAEPVGTDLPVIKDALGRPFIPGSSFKGVLRSRIESLVRAVVGQEWGACMPIQPEEQCVRRGSCKPSGWKYPEDGSVPAKPIGIGDLREGLDAKPVSERDRILARRVWDNSCLVCRTFGSPWLASHVQVKDLLVDETLWFGQYQVRNGVAIERDTETAGRGLLYDYEVVPADACFHCEIVVENAKPWQLGMLLLGLTPFQQGEISVGGFRSRGLGWVKLEELQLRYFSLDGGDKVEQLIGYLRKPDQSQEVTKDEKQKWVDAFEEELKKARKRAEEAARREG